MVTVGVADGGVKGSAICVGLLVGWLTLETPGKGDDGGAGIISSTLVDVIGAWVKGNDIVPKEARVGCSSCMDGVASGVDVYDGCLLLPLRNDVGFMVVIGMTDGWRPDDIIGLAVGIGENDRGDGIGDLRRLGCSGELDAASSLAMCNCPCRVPKSIAKAITAQSKKAMDAAKYRKRLSR